MYLTSNSSAYCTSLPDHHDFDAQRHRNRYRNRYRHPERYPKDKDKVPASIESAIDSQSHHRYRHPERSSQRYHPKNTVHTSIESAIDSRSLDANRRVESEKDSSFLCGSDNNIRTRSFFPEGGHHGNHYDDNSMQDVSEKDCLHGRSSKISSFVESETDSKREKCDERTMSVEHENKRNRKQYAASFDARNVMMSLKVGSLCLFDGHPVLIQHLIRKSENVLDNEYAVKGCDNKIMLVNGRQLVVIEDRREGKSTSNNKSTAMSVMKRNKVRERRRKRQRELRKRRHEQNQMVDSLIEPISQFKFSALDDELRQESYSPLSFASDTYGSGDEEDGVVDKDEKEENKCSDATSSLRIKIKINKKG